MLCPGFSGSRPTSSATPAARSDASAPHWPEDRRQLTRATYTYGSDPSQLGELFLPSGRRSFSVCVVVHGGYWRAQHDRSLMTDLCLDLAAHGVAAWNVEYRRVGVGGGWPETFLDVAAAVDLLATLAAPLDLGRVSTVGHSAGGHLAFWAAARPTLPHGAPGADPAVRIGGAVSEAGVLDLALAAQIRPSAEPTRALLGPPEADPSRYELSSPRARVPLGIPQLLLHGDRDETVSIRIATSYAAAARDAGDPCELRVLSGVGHFEHIDARSYVWHMARDWLVAQASAERS